MSFETALGRVIGLRTGDAPDERMAIVAVDPVPACRRCMAGRGCGVAWRYSRGAPEIAVPAPSARVLVAGDVVELRLPAALLLRAASLAYGLPLAGLLLAAIGAALADAGEPVTVIAAGGGLLTGALTARRWLSLSCPKPLHQLELVSPGAPSDRAP